VLVLVLDSPCDAARLKGRQIKELFLFNGAVGPSCAPIRSPNSLQRFSGTISIVAISSIKNHDLQKASNGRSLRRI
jgi:hypothetical protein